MYEQETTKCVLNTDHIDLTKFKPTQLTNRFTFAAKKRIKKKKSTDTIISEISNASELKSRAEELQEMIDLNIDEIEDESELDSKKEKD